MVPYCSWVLNFHQFLHAKLRLYVSILSAITYSAELIKIVNERRQLYPLLCGLVFMHCMFDCGLKFGILNNSF